MSRSQVFNNIDRQTRVAQLNERIAPVIARLFNNTLCNDAQATCVIVDQRVDTQIDMHMCYAFVTFDRPVYTHTMQRIVAVCDRICGNDNDYISEILIDNHYYSVGDGDDYAACEFTGNMIRIWVRSWGASQYA